MKGRRMKAPIDTGQSALLMHYWRLAFRNMKRYAGFSLINITGLGLGLACCLLILLYVDFELSYDTYHLDADRIYRVAKSVQRDGQRDDFAANYAVLGPTLRENFSEVEYVVRVADEAASPVRYGDKVFQEEGIGYAEADLFNIFTMAFLQGDPGTALSRPNTIVLTKSVAEKYFGDDDPTGKVIQIDSRRQGRLDCEITGVIEDLPANTHLTFRMIISWATFGAGDYSDMGWLMPGNYPTYIKLAPGVDPIAFEVRISRLAHEYIGEELDRRGVESINFLQPLRDIHLYSHLNWELGTPGNPLYVYFFSAVGILILLSACMNFMNLTTARAATRAGEVGMRKVMGAQRRQLIWQFLGESVLMSLIATATAILMVELSIPYFNELTDMRFTYASILKPSILFWLFGLALGVGVIGGSYPAFFLSAFQSAVVLKGALRAGVRGAVLRKVLVVGQFSISIILIIGTIIFYRQLDFMKHRPLGFNKEQKLVLKLPERAVNTENYQQIKNEFLQYASISGATASSSVPGRWMYFWRLFPSGEEADNTQMVNCFQVDRDFLTEYGIELIAGQPWSANQDRGYILNEAAVSAFGWRSPEEALGNTIGVIRTPVVGVARNFHVRGLQGAIEPVGIFLMDGDFRYLSLTVNTADLPGTLAFVTSTYRTLFPETLYESFFLDADFNRQYRSEERLAGIISVFTVLGLCIASLGLFGMVSFIAEQRTREIGIRKVLGASVSAIVLMLSKEFTKWILVANIIAWPCAYYVMHRWWLQDFAYRIGFEAGPFVLGGILVLAIALITISYQALKAAWANPVNALKYE